MILAVAVAIDNTDDGCKEYKIISTRNNNKLVHS